MIAKYSWSILHRKFTLPFVPNADRGQPTPLDNLDRLGIEVVHVVQVVHYCLERYNAMFAGEGLAFLGGMPILSTERTGVLQS